MAKAKKTAQTSEQTTGAEAGEQTTKSRTTRSAQGGASKAAGTKTTGAKTTGAKAASTRQSKAGSTAGKTTRSKKTSAGRDGQQGPSHDDISRRAYEIWQEHGGEHGRHDDHWAQAERELREGRRR
jgi:hypothetical protein